MSRRKELIGNRFGRLVVIGDGDDVVAPNGATVRMLLCSCDCGEIKIIRYTSLLGTTKSCGCLNRENRKTNTKTHGDAGTRLHRCWKSMRTRCRLREESCNCCEAWNEYKNFKTWSLNNGYDDSKVLCRNGDVGDYEPSNCRWDTQTSNSQEANSKAYIVTSPEGVVQTITNLSLFERDMNLPLGGMNKVANEKRKHCRGWKCEHKR